MKIDNTDDLIIGSKQLSINTVLRDTDNLYCQCLMFMHGFITAYHDPISIISPKLSLCLLSSCIYLNTDTHTVMFHTDPLFCRHLRSDNNLLDLVGLLKLLTTRKPCCRKETARCRKCSFLLKFANNIHYKYKTSQASKAATLQSSKHADA